MLFGIDYVGFLNDTIPLVLLWTEDLFVWSLLWEIG